MRFPIRTLIPPSKSSSTTFFTRIASFPVLFANASAMLSFSSSDRRRVEYTVASATLRSSLARTTYSSAISGKISMRLLSIKIYNVFKIDSEMIRIRLQETFSFVPLKCSVALKAM